MKLAESTWQEIDAVSREIVVLIPTGSLEQHGPHLPLFTDSLLATAVAERVESSLRDKVLLTPTVWLGASGHHLSFPGSLSASFSSYGGTIRAIVDSLIPHGFRKFYVLNGHGGNAEPNGIALRELRQANPTCQFGHAGYFDFIPQPVLDTMQGPYKGIRHACEAETSLMLHIHPNLVRQDLLCDDGLEAPSELRGMVHNFEEITSNGSLGSATLAHPELGKRLLEAAVLGVSKCLEKLANGYVLREVSR